MLNVACTIRTNFMEHELLLVLLEELCGSGLVQEERVDTLDVLHAHLSTLEAQHRCVMKILLDNDQIGQMLFNVSQK